MCAGARPRDEQRANLLKRMRGALQVGEILCGRYQLMKALGEGGMGAVFLAQRLKIEKRVVIKTLHEEFGHDPTFRARFKREARVTSKIEHDNIVNVLDVDEHEGFLFYVMEYLEGEDLSQTLERERRLAWPRARGIALQLCAALAAAHRKKVVHRDLKPSNCFLVRRDDDEAGDLVKIIDFGIAQLLDTSSRKTGRGASSERAKLTLPGEVFGTLLYMSPEHYAGQPTDRRADVYAVGCILYQMLTGEVPIAYGPSFSHALASEHPVPPSQRAPDAGIPRHVDHLVLKALAKRPEDRFPDMDTLLAALERASDGSKPRASPQRGSRRRSPVDSSAQTLVRRPTAAAAPQPRSLDRRALPARLVLPVIATVAAAVALLAAMCRRAGGSDERGGGNAVVPATTPARAGRTARADVPAEPRVDATVVGAVEVAGAGAVEAAQVSEAEQEKGEEDAKAKKARPAKSPGKSAPLANLGDAEIKAVVASIRGALVACAELGIPGTTIKVDVAVGADGRVTEATAHKPARGSDLGNCLEKAAARANFPALVSAQRVTLPLRL